MVKKKRKEITIAKFEINFPKAPKKAKDKQVLFDKFLSLVEESKENLGVEVISSKRKRRVILDTDEFMFTILFRKPLLARLLLNDPEKNIDASNEVGNKVINYINTILGERAKKSRITTFKTTYYARKPLDLGKKLLGDATIAKINEEVKQTLNPLGIAFEYELEEKKYLFMTFSNKKNANILSSSRIYKDKIPFNLLRKEYDELADCDEIIKKLSEMEL